MLNKNYFQNKLIVTANAYKNYKIILFSPLLGDSSTHEKSSILSSSDIISLIDHSNW